MTTPKAQAQTVLLTGIASPVTDVWPYNGTEAVPFADQFFQAIEKYAASYLQFKAGGGDFKASMADYESYLADAKRMSALEDRRDPFIFSGSIGSQIVANPTKTR